MRADVWWRTARRRPDRPRRPPGSPAGDPSTATSGSSAANSAMSPPSVLNGAMTTTPSTPCFCNLRTQVLIATSSNEVGTPTTTEYPACRAACSTL
ncbi:hypothetical protein [Rhodococcoides fascians]|uniref:hypothetical protein n=1 Tax=Rhodococcoides fascians TaxID=1828 RepID=UPI00197ED4F7